MGYFDWGYTLYIKLIIKKMNKIKTAVLLLTLGIAFVGCSVQESGTMIVPTFENFDVPSQSFIVNGNEGGEIALVNGTIINIPPKCFIDANGNIVEGDVNIEYREFHHAEDVITSGIPMTYSEGSEEGFLITAGMMELRGSDSEGNELRFADGKEAVFNMPSYLDHEDVDFFALNESTGEWIKTGTPGEERIEEADARAREIERLAQSKEPFEPRKTGENDPVIQFSSGKGFDEIKGLETVLWKYAGTDEAADPFAYEAFNNNQFKVIRSEIVDEGLQTLEVEMEFYEKGDTIQTETKTLITWFAPVLTNSQFEKAVAVYADQEAFYQSQMEKKRTLEKIQEQSALVNRTFMVSGFGYFNCDVFTREPYVEGRIVLTNNNEALKYGAKVFLVNKQGKRTATVQQEYSKDGSNVRLLAQGENDLIVVMEGDRVATISQEQLDENGFGNGVCNINIDNSQVVGSVKDVKKLLATI